MATRPTWSGAIMLGGFPVAVQVYPVVRTRQSQSFKMLDPVHKGPVKQQLIDQTGTVVARGDTLRGYEVAKGSFIELGPEALALIEKLSRSQVVEVERFSKASTVPTDLAITRYRIVPDPKAPGAETSVQTVWNGLKATGRAAVIPEWCASAGARPSTLVVTADKDGLAGWLIPFQAELVTDAPEFKPVVDKEQADVCAAMIEDYSVEDFDLSAYPDVYTERRDAAINMALSGKPVAVKADTPTVSAPDLMAVLKKAQAAKKAAPKKAASRKSAKATA